MESAKDRIRKEIRHKLKLITGEEMASKNKAICENVVSTPEFQKAHTIMMYLSLPQEVDTTSLILRAWRKGKTIAVPKVSWQQHRMMPVILTSLDTGIEKDKRGLRTPVCASPVPIDDIDLIITPGIAFDRECNRLGRGGGYFDRFFGNKLLKAFRMALAFEEQIVEDIPQSPHDKKVDCVVTDLNKFYRSKD